MIASEQEIGKPQYDQPEDDKLDELPDICFIGRME
jgi:hypothetical protein